MVWRIVVPMLSTDELVFILCLGLDKTNNLQLEGNDKIFEWYDRKTVKHKTIS